jgi:hypothetical protein
VFREVFEQAQFAALGAVKVDHAAPEDAAY